MRNKEYKVIVVNNRVLCVVFIVYLSLTLSNYLHTASAI